MQPPSPNPYPCPLCGILIRDIEMVDGTRNRINNEPSPEGRIIPWPSTPTGVAVGRRVDVLGDGERGWAEHPC